MNIYQDVELDFSHNNYKILKAKQGDALSRFVRITVVDSGNPVQLDSSNCSAYVRYKKADGYSVMNKCDIIDNKIYFELTAQMLAVPGSSDVDIVIYNSTEPTFNEQGKMIDADVEIISTMNFTIEVVWNPLHESQIESADEFQIDNNVDELLRDLNDLKTSIPALMQAKEEVEDTLENIRSARFEINFEDGHLYYRPPTN